MLLTFVLQKKYVSIKGQKCKIFNLYGHQRQVVNSVQAVQGGSVMDTFLDSYRRNFIWINLKIIHNLR